MPSESTIATDSRQRQPWTPPQIRETANLARIVASGTAGGKTGVAMDGASGEMMD